MNRREFLKKLGILGAAVTVPPVFWPRVSKAALPAGLEWSIPAVKPQIINVFLYGGPSELAGNLTNITEINAASQNRYPDYMLTPYVMGDTSSGVITANGFWGPDGNGNNSAGGDIMEELIAGRDTGIFTGGDMSIYRTVNRVQDDNRGHGLSVTQNLLGHLDPAMPGIATNLAAIVYDHMDYFFDDKPLEDVKLPVVTFEGESPVFNLGDMDIDLMLRPVALNASLQTPYNRNPNYYLNLAGADDSIENLARQISASRGGTQKKINDAFIKRTQLDDFMTNELSGGIGEIDTLIGADVYELNNNFADMLKAAVHLAYKNEDTFFINLGSPGLGGWDDHSGALDEYPERMRQLMSALKSAVDHMVAVVKGNLVINVFGDFGRNVNYNSSLGWDHGNNQNFYTVGGWDIPGRVLGKITGTTELTGSASTNRLFTTPAAGSYRCEPMAIAATIYRYFGVQNPELLTGGILPIDESV